MIGDKGIKNLIQKYINGWIITKIIRSGINIIYLKTNNYSLSHIEHDSEANGQQVLKQP